MILRTGAGLLLAALLILAAPSLVIAPLHQKPPGPRPTLDFAPVIETGDSLPRLHSLLVESRGELLFEHYFHGYNARMLANLKSASKSVLAVLVGIALDRGLLPGLDTPISKYFPDLTEAEKRSITIENLITMRSGLETTSNRNYGTWVGSPNWVRFALTRPMQAEPGEEMIYSTGNTHLLSAILTNATQKSTWEFAQEALADPLGFTLPKWSTDPQGIFFGGNDMLMTPRNMLAIGETYLHKGRYGDRQVVPAKWVEESCTGRTRSPRSRQRYGYGWWVGEFDTFQTCYAWGYGGQYIFVMPELDLVIVATSSPDVGEDRRGYRGDLFDLIEQRIVIPIADTQEWDRLYGQNGSH